MSYIYSQALVAEYSRANCSVIDASVLWSGSPTHRPCLWHAKTMEVSRHSRFGLTCKPLTECHGAALLTWWRAASRATTYPLQGGGRDLTASAVECGTTWPASLAKYDPASHSLKTAQRSLIEDLTGCSLTLPASGLMRDGQCWEHPMWTPRTTEKESGFWQTPVADDAANRAAGKWNSRGEPKLSAQALLQPIGKWATPAASDATRGGTITDNMTGQSLVQMVNTPSRWPTPTVCGNYNRKGVSATSGDGLATAVQMYPTATATACKGWSPNHNRAQTNDRLDYTIERQGFTPGQQTQLMRLNPYWVEWLMGWPIGQTALKPLETAKYQEWQQQHSIF